MRMFWRALACTLFILAAATCFADIYMFVDENGRSHFSDVKLDDRYRLYMKVKPRADDTVKLEVVADTAGVPARTSAAGFIPLKTRTRYADMIRRVATEQKMDPALIHAVVSAESGYNERATSPKGARGLMQVMPETGKRFGVGAKKLVNPLDNLRAGTAYLRHLIETFSSLELGIAAYNAGEGAVARFGNAIPPFPETRAYVPKVLEFYDRYRRDARKIAAEQRT